VRWFSIGALAIASGSANAVGAVRLTLLPDALEVELVRAAPFARGFAPGAVAEEVTFRAPYRSIRGLVRDRRGLRLTFDPRVITPHNRFTLANFSVDPAASLAGAYAARARARLASFVLPLPLGVLAALAAPSSLVAGVVGRGSLGLVVAALVAVALREVVAAMTYGGPVSDGFRDAFEAQLAEKLGLSPSSVAVEVPVDLASLERDDDGARPVEISSRAIFAALGVAAVAVIALVLFQHVTELEPARAGDPVAATAAASNAAPAVPKPDDARAQGAACVCTRADSPIWEHGLPVVAILPFQSADDGAAPIKPTPEPNGRGRYAFEVAAVNDAATAVHDVRVTLTFARRNKKGKRVGATDRGLFWEGALAAGHAVKWRVKAPGTEMKLEAGYAGAAAIGTLEDAGLEPASPDVAMDLTRSPYRAVRLQGAKLLAYQRDPRAAEVVAALAVGAPPGESETLAELSRATAPLFSCGAALDADASESRGTSSASACVFNGGTLPAHGVVVRDEAAGLDVPIAGVIPPHEGVRVVWSSGKTPSSVRVRSQ
jgi:hypothetical protein